MNLTEIIQSLKNIMNEEGVFPEKRIGKRTFLLCIYLNSYSKC